MRLHIKTQAPLQIFTEFLLGIVVNFINIPVCDQMEQ